MSSTLAFPAATPGAVACPKAIARLLAPFLVAASVLYNFLLCFVDTKLFSIGTHVVIACEIVIIAAAFAIVWHRSATQYIILLLLAGYFYVIMLIRSEFDPKVLRDLLIPFAFFLMGSYLGSFRSADRLVTALLFFALGVVLFEWLALNTYLHYFDPIKYYVARGTEANLQADSANGVFIKANDTVAGLYINSTRFEARTLLPFLGEHRASGVFLEPVSAGNFGAIVFAWIFLRDRHHLAVFLFKTLAVAIILVLADARYGFYLSVSIVVIYFMASLSRPTMLFLAPFAVIMALVYAAIGWQGTSDNGLVGRLLATGHSLSMLDAFQVLGLQMSNFFVSGYAGDSGYGYVLVKIGLVGAAAIWGLFAYAPGIANHDVWRFKVFIAVYITSLLAISASLFSIKTAALLWFLYGTLHNPLRGLRSLPIRR